MLFQNMFNNTFSNGLSSFGSNSGGASGGTPWGSIANIGKNLYNGISKLNKILIEYEINEDKNYLK